jgi:hypothetical protein
MGYAELGRIVINQLLQAGFDVSVLEIPVQTSDADFGPLGLQAERLIASPDATGSADVNIVNMIPPKFAQYRLVGARNIGFSMFETDKLPADWVGQCNQMDAMWVPSEWVKGVFLTSGVTVPISVVGVDAVPTPVSLPRGGPFRLVSMFQWSARKNPVGLIRAYCAAFDGNPNTVLTLKTHRHTDPAQSFAFVQNAVNFTLSRARSSRGVPRIEIATEFFSARQIQQLHADSHAYVSLAHAEGWGLPAWEATLAGKPVIHTGWSAANEFVHEQGQVKYNLAPVYGMEDFVPIYDMSMNWAEPHLDDAIGKLRDLYANYDAWSANSRSHRNVINNRYSLARRVLQVRSAVLSA